MGWLVILEKKVVFDKSAFLSKYVDCMPELPEVEALRLSLLPHLEGKKINSIKILSPKIVSGKGTKRGENQEQMANNLVDELTGQTIKIVARRAKNLIFEFESNKVLVIHLKMTGQLVFLPNNPDKKAAFGGHPIAMPVEDLPNKHTHIIFSFQHGTLYYNDVRKFGYVLYYPSLLDAKKDGHFANLGIEPLSKSFTLQAFVEKMKTKKGVLKSVFLKQEVVVGLGNIYCDEVCFAACVLPNRTIASLSDQDLENLYQAIIYILPKATTDGGSSVSNYVLGDGSRGNYAKNHKVYKRAGKPCLVCSNILQTSQLAGRTTVFCTICQE